MRTGNETTMGNEGWENSPTQILKQKFAMLSLRTLFVHILRRFELSTHYVLHDNARGTETVLRPKLGVPVKLTRRISVQAKK